MNISIFGLGYVGCISLGCLAENGHNVIGVDVSAQKVSVINSGKSPIIEECISEIIARNRDAGKILATTDAGKAVRETELSFICVGTPSEQNGHTDINAVLKVAEDIGKGIKEKESFHVVVIRSTVPPGTHERVAIIIENVSGCRNNQDFAIVSNPEFLRQGSAVKDYYEPPYTLIATESPLAVEKMKEVYCNIKAPFVVSDYGVAEMIKYVNNAFHALKITFANEVGNICKKLNIDSHKLMEVFCMDKKLNLSPYYLKPGFAYGGSCLPKDLKALKTIARDLYLDCPIVENIERSNEIQKLLVLEQIMAFNKQRIGFLGLSFKAGTDDLRNSPIVDIIEQLAGKGFKIRIYDRNVQLSQLIGANKQFIMQKIPYVSAFISDDSNEVVQNSDVIVVVNRDAEFREVLDSVGNGKVIYDLVNIDFETKSHRQTYTGIAW